MVTPDRLFAAPSVRGLSYRERDAVIRALGFESYRGYLRSRLWKEIRQRAFALRGRRCQVCCRARATQIHHRFYTAENLAGRSLAGLVPSCRKCHRRVEVDESGKKRSLCEAQEALVRARAKW